MDSLLWGLLGYVIFPFWLLLGLLDYKAHQRTRIAATSGVRESLLHSLQTAQIGLPVLIVLFLEINALILVIIAAFVVAHTLTAYWDIAFTATRRHISPFEQFVHAFMIVLPITAFVLLTILHWGEARDLVRPGTAPAGAWRLALREEPRDVELISAILVASVLFGLLPALAELLQTWRAAARSPVRLGTTSNPRRGAGQRSSR